jgi:hypothetical protein
MPRVNKSKHMQDNARMKGLERAVSSLKFLHHHAEDLYVHKLNWNKNHKKRGKEL